MPKVTVPWGLGCPGGGVHPGWTGTETPRIRNKKHDWHICFFFPCFFFFLFSLNLRKQDLRRQHSGIGLPGPEGHVCIPSEGLAGGAGRGGGKAWWRQQDHRHTAVRVGVLGWFSRSVLHNQPAKSTSSTSDRLMKVWF